MKKKSSEISLNVIRKLIRAAVSQAGNQKLFAEQAGVSEAMVSLVLKGERLPSDEILRSIGVKKIIIYIVDDADGR